MNIEEALISVWNGNSIVFLGSGFSRGAQNSRSQDFKTADLLAKHLAEQAGGPIDDDLGESAEYYMQKHGGFALIDELKAEFTTSWVEEYHRAVAATPWRRVYTTNYDDVFEFSISKPKIFSSPTLKIDPFRASSEGLQIVHLNGYIGDLDYGDINTIFKLTDSSYVSSSVADSPWAITFRNDLKIADSVFLLGYSLFDLDIRRIFASDPELSKKTFFVLGNTPTERLQLRVARFGTLLNWRVEEFATDLIKSKEFAPKIRSFRYQSVRQIISEQESANLRDQNIIDLFELGETSDQWVQQSLRRNQFYFLERSETKEILDLLEQGIPTVVITAALGNGKSMFLRGLAFRAVEKGYNVFVAQEPSRQASIEFERLSSLDTKTLLIVDDYSQWMTEIRSFALSRKPNVQLVLAARDTTHDVLYTKLETILGAASVPEYPLDKLNNNEIEWFIKIFDLYGLWGKDAALSPSEKTKLLNQVCGSEIHGILLKQLKSGEIGRRLRELINAPSGSCAYIEVISSIFVLAILRIGDPRIENLYDIWGSELISSSIFRDDPVVRSLIDFDRWTVRARSSVVAEYVLQELIAGDVVPILLKLISVFESGSRAGVFSYKKAFDEIMRFSTLQHLLPEKGRLQAAIRFYEGAKEFDTAKRNPLFWFQYAIACVTLDDVDRAGKYFTTAYSIANKIGFDTFQIDNHYARFLLVEASQKILSPTEAMTNFRRARDIINSQLHLERLHYPYRVAIGYQSFVDQNLKLLDKNQVTEVVRATENIRRHIEALSENMKMHRYVRDCSRAMTYVISKCDKM